MRELWTTALLAAALLSCQPTLAERESLVTGPRVLAVRADPPEAKPGAQVSYRALLVDERGELSAPATAWSYCRAPKPLTENDSVSRACLEDPGIPVSGEGAFATGSIPEQACAWFGPETPPGGFRPRDPDATGGHYQPLRLVFDHQVAFVLERVTCNLTRAPLAVAIDLAARYQPNRNPTLGAVTASVQGVPTPLGELPPGADIALQVSWGGGDAEHYLRYDPDSRALVEQTEVLSTSWFVTTGTLLHAQTGSDEVSSASTSCNAWQSPADPVEARLWLVLRDDRGGVDFASYGLATRSLKK